MRKIGMLIMVSVAMFVIMACVKEDSVNDDTERTYEMITMKEAQTIFETEGDYIIVDVRRIDEFEGGHIPNAINIPNENIGEGDIPELPDKEQTIYVYCRSGNRSKQAADKLIQLGYTNIIEFGGILDWKGEMEK